MALQTAFQKFLNSQNPETRSRILELARDPLFTPRYTITLARDRELALQRLQAAAALRTVSVQDFLSNPTNIFTAHEALALIDASLSTKFTVQFNLFGGTLLALGTKRHLDLVSKIDSLQAVGCFALTELGYGNNAVEMETTATWQQASQEFLINSPTPLSSKFWITNGALHAHWAIVFAQLLIDGKNEGVHTFLVRIRNDDMTVAQGVEIEDMGMKMGCNGVDNAKLAFHGVKVPREALLNRYSDVNEAGVFTSTINGRRNRFLKVAERLLSGRICIASMLISGCKLLSVILVRFSAQRLSVGASGKSDTPILEYQLQQNALFPLISKTVCLNIALNFIREEFQRGSSDLVKLCCVIKPLVTWHSERLASIGRERMGGQGYLACNRVGFGIGFTHAGLTAEGDNAVLMQKVAKDLLTEVMKGEWKAPALKYCPKRQLPQMMSVSSQELLMELIKVKEIISLQDLHKEITEKTGSGNSLYDVWMKEESDQIQLVSRAYGERVCAEQAVSALSQRPDLFAFLQPTVNLFLLDLVKADLTWFLVHGVINATAAKGLEIDWSNAVKSFRPIVSDLVSSLGVPEHLIHAPAAGDLGGFYSRPNYGEHLPLAKL